MEEERDIMLNKELYNALEKVFGSVAVMSEGEPAEPNVVSPTPIQKARGIKTRIDMVKGQGGEQYVVKCPYCDKAHKHLYVSHLSYAKVKAGRGIFSVPNLVAVCYKHNCLADPERYRETSSKIKRALSKNVLISLGEWGQAERRISEYRAQDATLLDAFSKVSAESPKAVLRYLLNDRGLSEDEVYKYNLYWGKIICQTGTELNRGALHIIVPVYMHSILLGYQARLVPETAPAGTDTIKYYTPPMLKKSEVLYGIDNAMGYDFVVLVEGVFDVMRIGAPAVAILGKTPSVKQEQALITRFGHGKLLVIPDNNDPDSVKKAKKTVFRLTPHFKNGADTVIVAGDDPGSTPRESIWQSINSKLKGK